MSEKVNTEEPACSMCEGTGTRVIDGVEHACISCGGNGDGDMW